MKMNVEGVVKPFQKEVIEAVERIEEVKLTYVKNGSSIVTTLVFECEDGKDPDQLMALMKKAIKNTSKGKMMAFRVIPSGEIVHY